MKNKPEFAISEVLPGKLNALVKNIMNQMDVDDPNEAVRRINSKEWIVVNAGGADNIAIPYTYAKRLFGKDFLGAEAIEKVYGIKLEERDIPPIKCSKAQLKRFKELGFQLILQIKKTKDGNPITVRKINELADGKTSDGGKLLYSSDGANIKSDACYKNELFLDAPIDLCWKVSSKKVNEGTLSSNYLKQTEILIEYLKKVFDGNLPQEYAEAVKFFEMKKDEIAKLLSNGRWKEAGTVLEMCSITKLLRESIGELIYRMHLTERVTGEKLFPNVYVWTSRRDSDGRFVGGGDFARVGAHVRSCGPGCDWSDVGASFSLVLK